MHYEKQMVKMGSRVSIAVVCVTLLSFCVSHRSVSAPDDTIAMSPAAHFEFHIDPWISLHHFAFHYAREQASDLELAGRVALTVEDLQLLSDDVRAACSSLLDAYQPYLDSSLLFDARTRTLAKSLTNGPQALTDTAVRDALMDCMPTYEAVLWPRHAAAARKMLAALTETLQRHETTMAERLAAALEAEWPDVPIRVDLTPYANWAGAYTDDAPAHITLSSLDKDISGEFAFEILFHESAHTANFGQSILSATSHALEVTGLKNRRFWHYVLFFVSGRIAAEELGDADYVPFAKALGLADEDNARGFYEALEKTWDTDGGFGEKVLRAAKYYVAEQDELNDR